jgi:hypothetical protein
MGSIAPSERFLIFGEWTWRFGCSRLTPYLGNGWIASQFKEILQAQGKAVFVSNARIENREQVMRYV